MTDFVPPLAVSLAMITIAGWYWLLCSHVRELYRRRAELLGGIW